MSTTSSSKAPRSPHRAETSRELEHFGEIQGFVQKELFLLTERVAKYIFDRFFGKFSQKEMPETTGELLCTGLIQPSVKMLAFIVSKDSARGLHKSPTNFDFLFGDRSPEDLVAAAAEMDKLLQRIQAQYCSHQILLPEVEKRGIENQPYGKLVCIEQMSEKVQDAIKKGMSAGEFIRQEMIRPSGQKQEDIAAKIHVHQASLSYMLNGKTSLSPEMAAKLSHHFQTYTTQELLTLQAVNDAKKADRDYSASLPKHKDPTPA
jgi:addiction module HigA family antidote